MASSQVTRIEAENRKLILQEVRLQRELEVAKAAHGGGGGHANGHGHSFSNGHANGNGAGAGAGAAGRGRDESPVRGLRRAQGASVPAPGDAGAHGGRSPRKVKTKARGVRSGSGPSLRLPPRCFAVSVCNVARGGSADSVSVAVPRRTSHERRLRRSKRGCKQ